VNFFLVFIFQNKIIITSLLFQGKKIAPLPSALQVLLLVSEEREGS
jgi:hypothetical protein